MGRISNKSRAGLTMESGNVVRFVQRHARISETSTGHKSGLSSERETPVSRSIGKTNSAGTPRLDRVSQYQTWDCVVPIRSAKGFCPPAASQARFSASVVDMTEAYPNLGHLQPKTLCMNTYLKFGNTGGMREPVNPADFGRRVRELREELGWSQGKLGKLSGFSQSNIGWVEQGKGKDPKKQALAIADALGSTPDWLLYGTGDRQTGVRPLSGEDLLALYNDMPLLAQLEFSEAIKARSSPKPKKRIVR